MDGEGYCFFRALSHQLYGDTKYHLIILAAGVNYPTENPEGFTESSCEHSWVQYVANISQQGTWAGRYYTCRCRHIKIENYY